MNYGGIILSIRVPDRKGQVADIVLGHDALEGYAPNPPYLGAIVGRYANRIANGTFTLDGKAYTLPKNDGPNTLHGGTTRTFDKVVWDAEPLKGKTGVAFTYLSKDGEEGFPGNMKVTVTYTLSEANELGIDYQATTDKASPINVSQHSYFNLKRRRQRRDSRSRDHDQRGPLHARGQEPDSDWRTKIGEGNAVRFHDLDEDRGTDRRQG